MRHVSAGRGRARAIGQPVEGGSAPVFPVGFWIPQRRTAARSGQTQQRFGSRHHQTVPQMDDFCRPTLWTGSWSQTQMGGSGTPSPSNPSKNPEIIDYRLWWQGLDFLATACDPEMTCHLTEDEFRRLKESIEECVAHVIGSAEASTSPTSSTPSPTLRKLSFKTISGSFHPFPKNFSY